MARFTAWLLVLMVFLAGCESTENKAAGESIAAAVQAYKKSNGRYPQQVEDLVPRYLHAVPDSGRYFVIVYAAEPGGSQCWVAYQVHRDRYEEFDCLKGAWTNVEIEDSHVFRHPNARKVVPSAAPPAPPPKDPSPAPQDKAR